VGETLTQEELNRTDRTKTDPFFDTEHLKTDLKGRCIRGGAATTFGQGAKILIRMVSVPIMARLLSPEEFGLVGMVTVVTGFVLMFRDMGLSTAVIQRAEINRAQISTLFWINTGIGLALSVLTAALAPAIAWFYGEPRLKVLTLVLAMGFIFGGLTIQHQALLKRHMRFAALAVIDVSGILIGITAAIVAAYLGAGYWSLVFMSLVSSAAVAIGVWVALDWRPGWPCWHSSVRSMLSFGRNVIGYRIVNYLARNTDKMLLGRFEGRFVLGLYGVAYGLLMMPLSQITGPIISVALPALSRIQNDRQRYVNYYRKLIELLSFIIMPLTIFLAICSQSVINLLLGDQWRAASRIFQILAITAFIQPLSSTAGIVLLSLGRSGRLLKFGIFNSLVIVLSFAVGIQWGAIGIAAAYAIANYLVLFPSLWYCFRGTPVSVAVAIRTISRPAIASLVTAAVVLLAQPCLLGLPDLGIFVISFVIAFPAYLLMWILMPGGKQILRDFVSYIALIYPKKAADD